VASVISLQLLPQQAFMMTAATNDSGAISHLGVRPSNSDQPPGRTGAEQRAAATEPALRRLKSVFPYDERNLVLN